MNKTYAFFPTFPPARERAVWEEIAGKPHLTKQFALCFERADQAVKEMAAFSPFNGYLEYMRSGDRAGFEAEYFRRRTALTALLIAECLEYKGRYLSALAGYLLATATEYTWVLPAHVRNAFRDDPSKDDHDPLPRIPAEYIDLYVSATGLQLSFALALLEPELSALSGNLVDFVRGTVINRAILPLEQHPEKQHWLGICTNWNSFCSTNLLWTANLILAGDEKRFSSIVQRLADSVAAYYKAFPEDGCCNEGPGYWWGSVSRYFLFCEGIFRATGGETDPFRDGKFREMAEYIAHTYYTGKQNCHFYDCSSHLPGYYGLVSCLAERFRSPLLGAFYRKMSAYADAQDIFSSGMLPALFHLFAPVPPTGEQMPEVYEKLYPLSQEYYLHRGDLFLAVKGGTNGEPHNHLDVGQFVIGFRGKMAVLDLGSTQYRKDTFNGGGRYKDFARNSAGHNAPVFGEYGQGIGKEYHAESFTVSGDMQKKIIRIDLTKAYPAEAGVLSCIRTLTVTEDSVQVLDRYQCKNAVVPKVRLFHQQRPVIRTECAVEEKTLSLSDPWLIQQWGDSVAETVICGKESTAAELDYTIRFRP